jgi:ParB-like chromosome segregation protein Spo0J
MNSKMREGARNALTTGVVPPTMTEVDEAIFGVPGGSLGQLDEGRVVAKATPIMLIWRDPKQPRRAIPSTISMHSDGNPAEVVPMLKQWQLVAEEAAGVKFDVVKLLNGEGEGIDSDKFPSVTLEFLALVRLAQGIKADGLINPITVIESDGKLLIESGERRWLAYHLLHLFLGEQWAKIPAAKGNGNDSVWRQATENTQRRQLNAIGMARQIALLIIAARSQENQYQEYEDVVKAGVSDRRFYAQVADGNVHRIPRGMSERIQAAMDLSMEQLSRYRALLRLTSDEQINDALWVRADVDNWAERAIREITTLPMGKVSEVLQRPQWTISDLMALKEMPVDRPPSTIGGQPQQQPQRPAAQPPTRPIPAEWLGKHVSTNSGITGKVVDVSGDWIQIIKDDNRQKKSYHYQDMYFVAAPKPATSSTAIPGFDHEFRIGDNVRTRTGHEGEVVGLSGRLVTVRTKFSTTPHDHTLLTKIEKPAPVEQAKFVLGDHVTTQYGRTGIVAGMEGMMVLVNWDNSKEQTDMNVLHLELVGDPQINENNIEEDVDPDAPATERQWSEGVSIGGNNEMTSDKADSVEPKRIFKKDGDAFALLNALVSYAISQGDSEAGAHIAKITLMTDVQAISLHDAQALKPMLDDAHDAVIAYVAGCWQQVLDAAQ